MARIRQEGSILCWTLALVTSVAPAGAIDFSVNSNLDQIDDDIADGLCHTAADTCTLRAAVMQANVIPGAGARILLQAETYLLTRIPLGDNGPDVGDLNLKAPASGNPVIEIVGSGSGATIVDANDLDRAFRVESGRTAILRNLTIRNGTAVDGAGIHVTGSNTTLERVEIRDNTASGAGGGIFMAPGHLTVVECTIRDNVAANGGGIYASTSGFLTVDRSTISGNFASARGGGIYDFVSSEISNSTLSGNRANQAGGGLYSDGTGITSSTIVFNRADDDDTGGEGGGGVYLDQTNLGYMVLRNSLVAGNVRATPPVASDCNQVLSYEPSLLGTTDGCGAFGDGWALLNSLALLGPLADNGGPTQTHALLEGINAIDFGSPSGCTGANNEELLFDQRRFRRHSGATCDVGSYEFESQPLLFLDGFESGNTLAWSAEAPPLEAPDVYRVTDLDLRDPHVFVVLDLFGCSDITDNTPIGAQYSFNGEVQQSIATDDDFDGELDLSKLLAFRPFDPLAVAGRLDDGQGACPAPSPPASCDWRMPPVPHTIGYDGLGAGTCLEPLAGTTFGYSPAVASATAPCYLSEPVATSIPLLGATVPLQAARSAAQFGAGNPPASLTPGLWMGFLRESDADATIVTTSLGPAPLSSFLPGGAGNCAAHDDRDVGPQGESGWWIYFNFVASPVTFVGR